MALLACFLAACSPPPPAPTRAQSVVAAPPAAPPNLPSASNALPMTDAPLVLLDGTKVTLDGVPVGDVSRILQGTRLERVDGLFDALVTKREAWRAAHIGAEFKSEVLLRIPPDASMLVVKSLFQTAALARYPTISFVVQRTGSRELGRLVSAPQIPALMTDPPPPDDELRVEVPREKVSLLWMTRGKIVATTDVPREDGLPALAPELEKEWRERGKHREPTDAERDMAILHVGAIDDFRVAIAALDALHATKRMVGTSEMPAFAVTLSLSALANRDGIRSGRLDPGVIRQTVVSHSNEFRACYETAAKKNHALSPKLVLQFRIVEGGKVDDVGVVRETPDADSKMADCVVAEARKMQFPDPHGAMRVTFPLAFEISDADAGAGAKPR